MHKSILSIFVLVLVRLKSCGALLFLYLNLLYNKCDYKRYILESYLFYRITIINGVVIVGDARKMFLYIYI